MQNNNSMSKHLFLLSFCFSFFIELTNKIKALSYYRWGISMKCSMKHHSYFIKNQKHFFFLVDN